MHLYPEAATTLSDKLVPSASAFKASLNLSKSGIRAELLGSRKINITKHTLEPRHQVIALPLVIAPKLLSIDLLSICCCSAFASDQAIVDRVALARPYDVRSVPL
jgi:hypothetical protein